MSFVEMKTEVTLGIRGLVFMFAVRQANAKGGLPQTSAGWHVDQADNNYRYHSMLSPPYRLLFLNSRIPKGYGCDSVLSP